MVVLCVYSPIFSKSYYGTRTRRLFIHISSPVIYITLHANQGPRSAGWSSSSHHRRTSTPQCPARHAVTDRDYPHGAGRALYGGKKGRTKRDVNAHLQVSMRFCCAFTFLVYIEKYIVNIALDLQLYPQKPCRAAVRLLVRLLTFTEQVNAQHLK